MHLETPDRHRFHALYLQASGGLALQIPEAQRLKGPSNPELRLTRFGMLPSVAWSPPPKHNAQCRFRPRFQSQPMPNPMSGCIEPDHGSQVSRSFSNPVC